MREANRRVDDSNRITSHAASALTLTMGGMAALIGMEVASITATPLEGVNAIETVSLVIAPLVGVGIVLGLFLPLATRFQRDRTEPFCHSLARHARHPCLGRRR